MRRTIELMLLLALGLSINACDSADPEPDIDPNQPMPRVVAEADYTVTDSGLKYFDFAVGDGVVADSGNQLVVDYQGWLTTGELFDSSILRGRPFTFVLGVSNVIEGWQEGLEGMQVGGQRQLVIPPNLGYGPRANGSIPANSTLVFEVELLNVVQ